MFNGSSWKNYHSEKVHIVGDSFGAQVVTEFLKLYPDLVDHAVINSCVFFKSRLFENAMNKFSAANRGQPRERIFTTYTKLKYPQDMHEILYTSVREISADNLRRLYHEYFNYQLAADFGSVTAPVLILLGTREVGLVKKSMRALSKRLPNNKAFMVRGETPSFFLQNPQQFNRIVETWITDQPLTGDLLPLRS